MRAPQPSMKEPGDDFCVGARRWRVMKEPKWAKRRLARELRQRERVALGRAGHKVKRGPPRKPSPKRKGRA